MRFRRFFSAFFCAVLLLTLCPLAGAAEDKTLPSIDIQAKAALLVDQNTGKPVYAKNEHEQLYPASLTKIMTALLVLRAVDEGKLTMDQSVTASESAFDTLHDDGSSAGIKAGEVLTVRQLLQCLLIVSANEAGTILAETVSGSVSAFVEEMNAEAEALGCENTHFVNPAGLHDPQHYTSAWDLYLIASEALKYPDFLPICDSIKEVIPATNLSSERVLRTTNYLLDTWRALGYRYRSAHGIKTGSTSDAGYCLVSSAEKGDLRFLSVVMGCERVVDASGKADVKSFSETKRLFEWGFENFSYKTVQSVNDMLASIPVTLSQETNSVVLHPAEDVVVLLPNALSSDDLKRVIRFEKESAEAPVQAGEVLAEVVLSYGDTEYATIPLVALNDIDASRSLVLLAQVKAVLAKPIVKIVVVLVVGLLLALLIWKLTIGRRRYRYGKNVRPSRNYKGRKRGF